MFLHFHFITLEQFQFERPGGGGFWKCVVRVVNTLLKCISSVVYNKSKCDSRGEGERWYGHFLNGVDSSNKAWKATKIT